MQYQTLKKVKNELSKISKYPSQEIKKRMVNSTQLKKKKKKKNTRKGIYRTLLIKKIEYIKLMELNLFFNGTKKITSSQQT